MELKENEKFYRLTPFESTIIDLYRRAALLNFAELLLIVHNGKLVTANLTEKQKF